MASWLSILTTTSASSSALKMEMPLWLIPLGGDPVDSPVPHRVRARRCVLAAKVEDDFGGRNRVCHAHDRFLKLHNFLAQRLEELIELNEVFVEELELRVADLCFTPIALRPCWRRPLVAPRAAMAFCFTAVIAPENGFDIVGDGVKVCASRGAG